MACQTSPELVEGGQNKSAGQRHYFMISTLDQMLDSIPENRLSADMIEAISKAYKREVDMINYYSKQADNPDAHLFPFNVEGNSLIANFWVNDLSIPAADRHNWHGQNVSQWKYAGCILISADNSVSCHH
jgi:hypothetical protein